MEQFIHNVSMAMSDDDGKPLALEKILPLITHWKAIIKQIQL